MHTCTDTEIQMPALSKALARMLACNCMCLDNFRLMLFSCCFKSLMHTSNHARTRLHFLYSLQAASEASHAKTLADADDLTKWLKQDNVVRALFVGMHPPLHAYSWPQVFEHVCLGCALIVPPPFICWCFTPFLACLHILTCFAILVLAFYASHQLFLLT